MATTHIFLLEHETKKIKLEVPLQRTSFADFLAMIKSKCSLPGHQDVEVEFFDKVCRAPHISDLSR